MSSEDSLELRRSFAKRLDEPTLGDLVKGATAAFPDTSGQRCHPQ